MRLRRYAGWLVAAGTILISACAPAAPTGGSAGPITAAQPTGPKRIFAISSGNPPGLDNRFVVSSNNANRVAVPLYASALILSDLSAGLQQTQLAEAIPSVENGLWKVNADNT